MFAGDKLGIPGVAERRDLQEVSQSQLGRCPGHRQRRLAVNPIEVGVAGLEDSGGVDDRVDPGEARQPQRRVVVLPQIGFNTGHARRHLSSSARANYRHDLMPMRL